MLVRKNRPITLRIYEHSVNNPLWIALPPGSAAAENEIAVSKTSLLW